MGTHPIHESKSKRRRSIGELLTESIGFVQIAASPFLIGAGGGILAYYGLEGKVGLIGSVLLPILGLTIGIWLATRVWRKVGTIKFMSRVTGSPELDRPEEQP